LVERGSPHSLPLMESGKVRDREQPFLLMTLNPGGELLQLDLRTESVQGASLITAYLGEALERA